MTFLPIVQRELRVACRKRGTYRIRWWTAALAVVASLFMGTALSVSGSGSQSGAALFRILTGYAFGLCLVAGAFLTADSLSQEKREGTLGLLFLTDLKGYDIVLGKFMATSLNAAYGVLALMPAIGLSILFGGVTGGEFWRMNLALLNALFVSLCAGLAVSAFMRDSHRALGNTLGLMFLLCAALPLFQLLFLTPSGGQRVPSGARTALRAFEPGWLSPVYPFMCAHDSYFAALPSPFLRSLIGSHLAGWCMLALASWRIPRFALEETRSRKISASLPSGQRAASARAATPNEWPARAKLLEKNPILWLLASEPAASWLTWSAVLAWAGTVLIGTWATRNSDWVYGGAKVCGFFLKLLIGLQACRFFVQARQNGMLEMLASTPVTNDDLLRGQWLAARRLFLWPCVILLTSTLLAHGPYETMNLLAARGSRLALLFLFVLTFAADVVTVTLVGMWLSLSMRRPTLAPAATLLFVLVLPSLLCGLDLLLDILLALWAWRRLQQDFRYVHAGFR